MDKTKFNMERNYDFEGSGSSQGGSWLVVQAPSEKNGDEPYFLMDKEKVTFIQGYLDKIEVRGPLEPKDRLPERNEVVLTMSIPTPEGVKQYRVSFSDHWKNPVVATVVNCLAGAVYNLPDWNQGLKISLYSKKVEGKTPIMRASVRFLNSDEFIPAAHPWDEATGWFNGVPRSDVAGDHSEENAFWIDLAKKTAAKFNGAGGPVSIQKKTEKDRIYTITANINQKAGEMNTDMAIQAALDKLKKWSEALDPELTVDEVTKIKKTISAIAAKNGLIGDVTNWKWFPKTEPEVDDLPF